VSAEAAATSTLKTGDLVGGRYQIQRFLGSGGMGAVYAAVNNKTGRQVAVKILRDAAVTDERKRRFLREAKATNAIGDPHVVDVLDVFEDADGSPVMVMELLEGETLRSRLKREEKLPLEAVAEIFVPVCRVLEKAHAIGIVHRDLKPDNIFLAIVSPDEPPMPKVLDFGIAKVMDPATLVADTHDGQTNTGTLLGTPHYMSLEQAMSEKDIDRRADVWAIGVMLFEAITGRRPLVFENLGQMYTQLLQEEVPSIRDHAELPEALATVIDRCLVKDRTERLDDIAVVTRALMREDATPPDPVPPKRRRWPALAAALAAAALGAIAFAASEDAVTLLPLSLPTAAPIVAPVASEPVALPSASTPAASSARTVSRLPPPAKPPSSASAAPAPSSARGGLIEGDPYAGGK
jgi:serine/threonine-protein kinase